MMLFIKPIAEGFFVKPGGDERIHFNIILLQGAGDDTTGAAPVPV
jgi:hypothetical protein